MYDQSRFHRGPGNMPGPNALLGLEGVQFVCSLIDCYTQPVLFGIWTSFSIKVCGHIYQIIASINIFEVVLKSQSGTYVFNHFVFQSK